jgi:hypothetical protein
MYASPSAALFRQAIFTVVESRASIQRISEMERTSRELVAQSFDALAASRRALLTLSRSLDVWNSRFADEVASRRWQ